MTKMVNHVAPVMAEVFPDSTWEERRGYHVLRGDGGMTADEVIDRLQLQPHPVEGGFFRETYR